MDSLLNGTKKKEEWPVNQTPLNSDLLDYTKFHSKYHWAARYYINIGLLVFPLLPGKKTPLTPNGFKDASRDVDQIDQWWRNNKEANIGIVSGTASKLVVLDFDTKDGYSAEEGLCNFEEEFGKLPDTPYVLTGGGGYQFYFRSESEIKCRHGFRKQVDVKSQGGYVVAPPSLHPSGNIYEWEAMFRPSGMSIATLPSNIEKALSDRPANDPKPETFWTNLIKGVSSGGRNSSAAQLAGYFFRRKVHRDIVRFILTEWNKYNQPPLSSNELEAVINSIHRLSNEIGESR